MSGLLEKLNEEDREKVKSWGNQAKNPTHKTDIPPELFICAKLGFYYGWEAMKAFKLGYIVGYDEDMNPVKIPYTLDEAVADVKSAEKVNYRNLLDQSDFIGVANRCAKDNDWAMQRAKYANQIRKEINE